MEKLSYDSVLEFVRTWSTDPLNPPYDFNGVIHLMLAAIDNLRGNAMEHELESIGCSMTDEQREFLIKIASRSQLAADAKADFKDN